MRFGLLLLLFLLKLFPLLFLLSLSDKKIALYSLLIFSLVFLHELLLFFLLLFCRMKELTVLTFAAESCLNPELTRLFGLLLVDERTVLLNTFAACIIPADFAPFLSLHGEFGDKLNSR